jgi:tight adherence protein B
MLDLATPQMIMAILVATAIGGLGWVFLYPILSGERHVEKRRASAAQAEPVKRSRTVQKSRREQVEDSLKDLESRQQKNAKLTLQ